MYSVTWMLPPQGQFTLFNRSNVLAVSQAKAGNQVGEIMPDPLLKITFRGEILNLTVGSAFLPEEQFFHTLQSLYILHNQPYQRTRFFMGLVCDTRHRLPIKPIFTRLAGTSVHPRHGQSTEACDYPIRIVTEILLVEVQSEYSSRVHISSQVQIVVVPADASMVG